MISRSISAKGFTLIELLTVIAILAILASILIPVVGSVRTKARGAACQTMLRQIGVAMFMYAEDNDGTLPPFNDRNRRPAQGLWWLHGLMGQNEIGQQRWPNYLDDRWFHSQERAQNLICPQSSIVYPGIYGVGYGMNLFYSDHEIGARLDSISTPTNTVLVADAVVHTSVNWYDSALGPLTGGYPNTTHDGGANYLFAAGNIRFIQAQNPGAAHSPPLGMTKEVLFKLQ